jgi:hypothetical protein
MEALLRHAARMYIRYYYPRYSIRYGDIREFAEEIERASKCGNSTMDITNLSCVSSDEQFDLTREQRRFLEEELLALFKAWRENGGIEHIRQKLEEDDPPAASELAKVREAGLKTELIKLRVVVKRQRLELEELANTLSATSSSLSSIQTAAERIRHYSGVPPKRRRIDSSTEESSSSSEDEEDE